MQSRRANTSGSGGTQRISPEYLEQLRERVSLVDVVSEHVVLRKSGANHVGLCPFHSERTPSFSVHETKGLYHCYGCKEGGDLIGFVRKMHGLSFTEAIEELSDRAKLPLPKDFKGGSSDSPEAIAKREKLALAYKLNRFALKFYQHSFAQPAQKEAHDYCKSRGFLAQALDPFFVGAAPGGWDGFSKQVLDKKAPVDLAMELGLIRQSPPGRSQSGGVGYFDLFRGRVMFPLVDLRGKVCGFGGRALDGQTPKYLNSTESFIFQKSKLLFGLFQASKHIREKNEAIVVEGYYDVIAMHRAGFENTVAPCGTALSEAHLDLLSRFCDRVIVLFDPDSAGQAATLKSMEMGLKKGKVLYSAQVPLELDPDEFLIDPASGNPKADAVAQLQKLLTDSRPIIDAEIDQWVEKAKAGAEAKTQAVRQVSEWLHIFTDPVGKDIRLQDVAKRLGVSPNLLTTQGNAGKKTVVTESKAASRPVSHRPLAPRGKLTPRERYLFQLLAHPQFDQAAWVTFFGALPKELTVADLFDFQPLRKWVEAWQAVGGVNVVLFSEFLGPQLSEMGEQLRSMITEVQFGQAGLADPGQIKNAIGGVVRVALERFSQRFRISISEAEALGNSDLEHNLKKEYLDVQRRLKELNNFYDEIE